MQKAAKVQYTIRSVPRELDRLLRSRAKAAGLSLNAFLLQTLARVGGMADGERRFRDLDDLIGSWVHDPECEATLASFRVVNPDDWR